MEEVIQVILHVHDDDGFFVPDLGRHWGRWNEREREQTRVQNMETIELKRWETNVRCQSSRMTNAFSNIGYDTFSGWVSSNYTNDTVLYIYIPSWKLTYPLFKALLKMMFLFPFGAICIRSLEGISPRPPKFSIIFPPFHMKLGRFGDRFFLVSKMIQHLRMISMNWDL